jgi:signal peptidase I
MSNQRPITNPEFAELSEALLREGRAVRFRASGISMRPFIREGDILTVKPIDPAKVRRGDVVLFKGPRDRVRAHRVIRITHDGERLHFTARGDNAIFEKEDFTDLELLGLADRLERGTRQYILMNPFRRFLVRIWYLVTPLRTARGALRRCFRPRSPHTG